MPWIALLALIALIWMMYGPTRDWYRFYRITHLFRRREHDAALAAPLPRSHLVDEALWNRAGAAVLTGRYRQALADLATVDDTEMMQRMRGASRYPDVYEIVALMGIGEYRRVAMMLGDDPSEPHPARLRAQVAIEMGDDELAERLLASPGATPLDEGGRLRILGDLHARRGRSSSARSLLEEAYDTLGRSRATGSEVDQGYCLLHLSNVMADVDETERSIDTLQRAERLLATAPDNRPGMFEFHAAAAHVWASAGQAETATFHAEQIRRLADDCESPPMEAQAHVAFAEAANAARAPVERQRHVDAALEIFDELGAAGEVDRLMRLFG